jgi:methyltransferase (TIGR00027 family)
MTSHRNAVPAPLEVAWFASGGSLRDADAMLGSKASHTALIAAANRAAHVAVDKPVILADSLARLLSGELGERMIRAVEADPLSNLGRFHFAARARWAEDTLEEARREGVDQYLLLGAGLDSFAYRHQAEAGGLRVYEVDHPATQAWKRERLAAAGILEPDTVIFVPVDFERDDFAELLLAHGFAPGAPSVVAWLGVTYYLTNDANEATLRRIARWTPETRLVIDYRLPERAWDSFEPPWNTERAHALMRSTAQSFRDAGEPWLSYYEAREIERLMRRCGFRQIEHLDNIGIRSTYMNGQTHPLPGPAPYTPLLRARV